MAIRIQIRRDTSSNWTSANPILAQGEEGHETDTNRRKIGNGTDEWVTLPYLFEQQPTGFLEAANNLSDLNDIPTARTNLDVYSKAESDALSSGGNPNLIEPNIYFIADGESKTIVENFENVVSDILISGFLTIDGRLTVL